MSHRTNRQGHFTWRSATHNFSGGGPDDPHMFSNFYDRRSDTRRRRKRQRTSRPGERHTHYTKIQSFHHTATQIALRSTILGLEAWISKHMSLVSPVIISIRVD